jgi:glycosyltransferase involved in cell wall biosynthesis
VRILQVIASLAPRYGGPSTVAPEMCRALRDRGHHVEILTTDRDGHGRLPVPTGLPTEWRGVPTTFFRAHRPQAYAASVGLGAALRRRVAEFDIVHVHSLYLFHTVATGHWCRRFGVPYVVRPHGTLDPYHRSRHRWRKFAYTILVERGNVDAAGGIHYTSTAERDHAQALGFRAPEFVVPLGVDVSALDRPADSVGLLSREPRLDNRPLVTYLGRLTHKKRLDLLVEAFAKVAGIHADVHLVVAGPDDEGMGQVLRARIATLGLDRRFVMPGLIEGEAKTALLQRSSVFVLPSEDENFAVSVVEAMATGCPVVVTPGVALHREIADSRAGLVVPLDADAVGAAICRLVEDRHTAASMGAEGRQLVRSRFSWDRVAIELEFMYDQVKGASHESFGRHSHPK